MTKPRILLIYTGGTIGMIQTRPGSELKPFDFESILKQVPEIASFGYAIDAHAFDNPIDSSNIQPALWTDLAHLIAKNYAAYDGFVVLHGTDTMAYTASALSFMLRNLGKPVLLTGSQLPIGHVRTDAKENLITSIEMAAAQQLGKVVLPEVAIYFDYALYRGNRAIKYNAEKFEAFHSPNYPLLAEAGIRITYHESNILPHPINPLEAILHWDDKLGNLKVFPGMRPGWVENMLADPALELLVLEGFGAGNVSTEKWLTEALKSFINAGKTVIDITQCHGGRVELGKYETSIQLLEMGVCSGHDMTFEACITKGMHLLGLGLRGQALGAAMENPLCGELNRVS